MIERDIKTLGSWKLQSKVEAAYLEASLPRDVYVLRGQAHMYHFRVIVQEIQPFQQF